MILQLVWYFYLGLVVLSFLMLGFLDLLGLRHKSERKVKSSAHYRPRTLVMAPCKGPDLTLEDDLRSLKNQKYDNYDLVAIVESNEDEALVTIKKLKINFILSTAKCNRCSAKVRSISTALERMRGYDVYVIADSDILVDKTWLASLVAPLADREIGLSTMYPYFKPLGGFWSLVKMMWGFVGDSLLERESTRFGWGGSLAFRGELMDKKSLEFFKDSKYSVSDDICLTKIAKSKGLRIAYVRTPKPIVNCKESFHSFFEWANRQTALTLLGYRRNLYMGVAFYSMEILVLVSGVVLSALISPVFLVLLLHPALSVIKAYRRAGLRSAWILLITLMMPFLYEINLLRASTMRTITWRGHTYRMR